ncbi:DNA primase [Streptococcus mutans]|uniref:DNA primase n=1 Tax=Streptococcus mutans TaxID=1309 RepID=UPI00046345C7|nr:DNA primase [Streptococcus mutans]MCB5063081.1 DNA primase [Streptococcus mutans]
MVVDKEKIKEIKDSINIVDVIGEVVSLSRSGRNYLGLCPFHKEKTPSFNVIEDRQFFHCFGCGRSGDVFKFVEDYRNISFLESVQVLAERSGINVTLQDKSQEVKKEHPHQKLFNINEDANKFYQAVLKTTKVGETARQYLYERGLTDELITYFKIGLAPNEYDYLYQAMLKKYDEDTIINSGLFNLSDSNSIYDAFRNRIMFPLADEFGHIIGFSGRIWTEEDTSKKLAKYKNTRSTIIFNKSYELYHLDKAKAAAKKEHELYLMEGFMDVIAAYRAGIPNAVASMGTALTSEHVKHLRKFTKKVILTYDGDKAGQNAIAKSLDLLSNMAVEIVRIPGQMDPDEFIKENSEEELEKLLKQARISSAEFWIEHLKPENIDNLQAEIDYVEKIAKVIAASPSITAQNTYINKVAEFLPDFDYLQVEQAVNNERLQTRSQISEQESANQQVLIDLPVTKQLTALTKAESQLFHRLLHHDYLLNEFRNRAHFKFTTPELQELYQILKTNGEINAYDLSQLSNQLQETYYRVLEENLPEEIAEDEIKQIEDQIDKCLQRQEMRKQSKAIRESSNHGDVDTAVEGLAALIAQKRNME